MSYVDLYWLPVGAGGHSVRVNGQVFESVVAWIERRPPRDLYHSALVVQVPEGRFVIEQGPAGRGDGSERGAVRAGAVGSRRLGRFRLFRYEVRRWRDGVIPDVGEAVESPRRLTKDVTAARRVLELVPLLPTPVWGRDELGLGEMWNSNSVIAWLLERAGVDAASIRPPAGGRAPGWSAGVAVARTSRRLVQGRRETAPELRRHRVVLPQLAEHGDHQPAELVPAVGVGLLHLAEEQRERALDVSAAVGGGDLG